MTQEEQNNTKVEKQLSDEEEYQNKVKQKLNEELDKNSKPMWLTKAFVNQPCAVLSVCAIIFVICIILTGSEELGTMSKNHDRDYLIWDNERTLHFDMLKEAQDQFMKGQQNTVIPLQSIPNDKWMTFVVLQSENEDDTILTVDNIKLLNNIEQKILNLSDYPKFCLATTESTDCDPQNSFLSFNTFLKNYATDNNIDKITQKQIDQALSDIQNDEILFQGFKGLFAKSFTEKNDESYIIRSMFLFGGPLKIDGKRYKDIFDKETEQTEHFNKFSEKIIDIVRDEDDNEVPEGTLVLPYSLAMMDLEMQNVINTDFLLAFGSIVFVWIYMSIHLRSLFLGSMSMVSIVISFPITLVIFKLICMIDFFSSLHVLVIFIVLGISADNVFVFTDAWNQTAFYEQLEGDLNKRMAVTYRRATKAMFATSSTTGAAFLATGLSPIMPISSFGFFAGILIPVNFILVITFYPALLMIFEKYTKNMCSKKQTQQQQQKDKQTSNNNIEQQQNQIQDLEIPQRQYPNQESLQDLQKQKSKNGDINQNKVQEVQNNNQQQLPQENSKEELQKPKEHPVLVFFETKFNSFVFKFRYPIILIFLVWTGISIWRTTQLPSLSEPEQFLPDDYDVVMAMELMRYNFTMSGNSDTGIKVYHYWGVKDLDKSDVGMWESEDLGDIKWDDDLNLAPEKNQQFLYDLCEDYKDKDFVVDGLVNCFMIQFQQFVGPENFPVPEDDFMDKLKEFVQDPLGQSYYNENAIGIIDNKLKYFSIELSSIGVPFSPYKDLNPTYEKWDDHVKQVNKEAPKGLKNSQQTAKMGWVFMITEKAFSSSAVQGTLIAVAFAFCVLLITTHNIVISIYSIFSISSIVTSVITVMELSGWELGVAESVAIVILIGLSVDYVVHLANHYVECPYPDRFRKMRVSLKDLGISIISGASTTIGSGIFLFFATIIMFNKFAILIISTICFSLAYSLLFFAALVHIIGPQGDCGNLLALCKKKQSNQKEVKYEVEKV